MPENLILTCFNQFFSRFLIYLSLFLVNQNHSLLWCYCYFICFESTVQLRNCYWKSFNSLFLMDPSCSLEQQSGVIKENSQSSVEVPVTFFFITVSLSQNWNQSQILCSFFFFHRPDDLRFIFTINFNLVFLKILLSLTLREWVSED